MDTKQAARPMWELEKAVEVVRWLEARLSAHGYHCALTGGVIFKGSSEKDLDIIIYPHTKGEKGGVSREEVWLLLQDWLHATDSNTCQGTSQFRDDKDVRWIQSKGKRIDFFFLD